MALSWAVNSKEEVQHGNLNLISIMCVWASWGGALIAIEILMSDFLWVLQRVERGGDFSSKSDLDFSSSTYMVVRPSWL